MSSYIYDPHRIRQKPNRYYQRKGQILRAKYLDTPNPAISKEDASRYITAVKTYFPEQFQNCDKNLKTAIMPNAILSEIPNDSYIIPYQEPTLIYGIVDGYVIMFTTSKNPPNILDKDTKKNYQWNGATESEKYVYSQYWLRPDGILTYIDITKTMWTYRWNGKAWQTDVIILDKTYNLFLYQKQGDTLTLVTDRAFTNIYLD